MAPDRVPAVHPSTLEEPARPIVVYGPPAVLGVLLVMVLGALYVASERHDADGQRREASEDAHIVARNLALRLAGTQTQLAALARHLGRGDLDEASFGRSVRQHVSDHPEVVAVTWIDVDHIVRWAAPPGPADVHIGRALATPAAVTAARRARNTREPVWSSPLSTGGSPHVELFVPAFDGDLVLGTVGGEVDVRLLFDAAVPLELGEAYRVSLVDEDGLTWEVTGSGDGDPADAAEADLDLGATAARVRLVPNQSAADPAGVALTLVGVGLTASMTFVLWSFGRALRRHQHARVALAASERRVADLVRSSGDVIFTLAPDGRITDVNPVFERVTGWRREEWLGLGLGGLLHPDDAPTLAARLAALPRTTGLCEVRVRTCDGAHRVLELSIDPRADVGTTEGGAVAVARDVTSRKRFEEQLARELEQSTLLGDLARELAGTVSPSAAAGRVAWAAAELTRSPTAVPVRVDAADGGLVRAEGGALGPDWTRLCDWTRQARAPLFANTPGAGGARHLIVPALFGEEWVGAVGVTGATTDYDERDVLRLERVAALWATYLERSRAGDALLASEQRWRHLLDRAADPIFVHDTEGRFVEVNVRACESLGYTAAELLQLTVFDVDTGTDPASVRRAWEQAQGGGASLRGVHRRKDGSTFPVEVNLGRGGNDGRLLMSVARDITAHRRTEELLAAIASGLSTTGDGFFHRLVELLSGLVPDADCVLVGQLTPEGDQVRTMAMQMGGEAAGEMCYPLAGTPCELSVRDGHYVCHERVQEHFPEDAPLREMAGAAYVGFALRDEAGRVMGVLAMISRKPLADAGLAASIIEIFAARASAELERTRAEATVRRERSFLQQVIDGVPESILVVGTDHRVLLMNTAARAAAPPGALEDFPTCHRVRAASDSPCDMGDCPLESALLHRRTCTLTHQHTDSEGKPHFLEVEATPLIDPDGSLVGVIETSRDVTARKCAEDELREQSRRLSFQATHDRLTGLPNRTLLNDRLRTALTRARRSGSRVAVLFVDLDAFKPINDTYGHEAGDGMLQVLGRRLRLAVREGDTVARLGGDEFVVLLENLADAAPAAAVARKLIDALTLPVEVGGHELRVGASIGIAVYPTDGDDEEVLLRTADTAMYAAKLGGGQGFRYHAPQEEEAARVQANLGATLERAVRRGELRLLWQPVVDLESSRIVGAEALVRWEHPDHGLLLPDQFLPAAIRAGLVGQVGAWVLGEALDVTAGWARDGIAPVKVSVNLALAELRDPSLPERVLAALGARGLKAGCLALEITEASLMDSDPQVRIALDTLTEHGVALILDACGTGAASASTLKRYPLLALKIDRAFVRGLCGESEDETVVSGLAGLARSLGIDAVGMGIERADQLDFLRKAGCRQGQGHLLGRPMIAAELAAVLKSPPG